MSPAMPVIQLGNFDTVRVYWKYVKAVRPDFAPAHLRVCEWWLRANPIVRPMPLELEWT